MERSEPRSEASDAELLAATRRGERAAFGALVERYQGVVCAVTYSRTGDRALSEDVAQDTFLAAWGQLDQLREVGRLRAWLCGIARNLARKARRRSSRELMAPVAEPASEAREADPFAQVSASESEELVRAALHQVPETYREALVLYYREQRSVRQVAAALEISEAAALQRLSRGRQYLADGVTALIERSLRSALPRKSLVAGVLALLPPLTLSHADATPSSHGVPMIKLALLAAAIAAAGTAAYVTNGSSSSEAPKAQLAASPVATAVAPPAAPHRAAVAAAAPAAAERADEAPCQTCDDGPSPEPEALPIVDAATLGRLKLHEGPSQGVAEAPVTVVVFNDLQCHFCGETLGNLDQLLEDYPSKLRIVMKQMPVHKTAELGAEAALAAQAQGKFWELHDLMMAQQEDLSQPAILALAKQAGLDVAALRKALEQHTYAAAVKQDMATAVELEINGTPAFVVNGKRIVGHRPIAEMRKLVDEALARAGA